MNGRYARQFRKLQNSAKKTIGNADKRIKFITTIKVSNKYSL